MQRRYISGQRIVTGSNEEFQRAKQGVPSSEPFLESTETLKPRSARGGLTKFGAGTVDISRTAPTFNDPRYSFTTLAIPTDRRTLNGLYRFFDDTDPIVGTSIQLHVEFPLSKIELTDCGIPGIQQHYKEMWDRIHGEQLLMNVATEFFRIGDVFTFGAWNEEDYMWDQFAILNPDYVTVESTWINKQPLIKLQPDESLKRIVSTGQPRALFEQLPEMIVRYVRMQKDIPLDPNNAFHLAYNKAPYEIYGKSIIKRILKLLVYEHRMHEAQFAIATRHVIPLTVVKVGDPASGWIPNQDEIDAVQELIASREIDPSFTIVYHWGINVEFYGASGKILPLQSEFDRVTKLKFLGLGISEQLLTGGGGTYAQAYASLEVLRQRYLHFQNRLESFVHNGIFEPVAKMAGWYKTESLTAGYGGVSRKFGDGKEYEAWKKEYAAAFGSIRDQKDNKDFELFLQTKHAELELEQTKKEFIFPKLNWDKLSLSNDQNYKNFLVRLNQIFPKPGGEKGFEPIISKSTMYQVARLDEESEKRKLAQEADDDRNRELIELKKNLEFKQKKSELERAFGVTAPPVPGATPGGGGGGGEFVPEGSSPAPGGGEGEEKGTPKEEPKAPVGENPFLGVTVPPHASVNRPKKTAGIELPRTMDTILDSEEERIQVETGEEISELRIANGDPV